VCVSPGRIVIGAESSTMTDPLPSRISTPTVTVVVPSAALTTGTRTSTTAHRSSTSGTLVTGPVRSMWTAPLMINATSLMMPTPLYHLESRNARASTRTVLVAPYWR
jgi:hypothetical protein